MLSTFYIILLLGVAALSPVIAEPDLTRYACADGSKPVMLEGARGVNTSPGFAQHYPAKADLVSVVHCGPQSATLQLGAIPAHARREDGEVFVEGHANRPGCKVAFSSSDPEDTMLTFPYHTCGIWKHAHEDYGLYDYSQHPDLADINTRIDNDAWREKKLMFDVVLGVRQLEASNITVARIRVTCEGRTQYETPKLTTYDIRLPAQDVEPPYTFRVYDKSKGEESADMTRIANGDVITLAATFTHRHNIIGRKPLESNDKLALYNCEMFAKGRFHGYYVDQPPKLIIDKNGCPAVGEQLTIEQIPNHGTEVNFLVKGLPYNATVHFRCSIYLCYHGQTAPPGINCNQPSLDWCADPQHH